jgi:hypothetical protein
MLIAVPLAPRRISATLTPWALISLSTSAATVRTLFTTVRPAGCSAKGPTTYSWFTQIRPRSERLAWKAPASDRPK